MNKQQIILLGSGILLFCLIYFFGQTVPPKKNEAGTAGQPGKGTLDFERILEASKKQLTLSQQAYISQLETAVVRGDVKEQQVKVYRQIAGFWKDSAHLLLPYSYYTGQAAKLENSEKSLTFAAHNFLDGLRQQSDPELRTWMAGQAKELFENALKINPASDSSKVGLGSCYLFGHITENPMQGILMIREVAEKDSNNMYAQFMLALGGMESGQYDKAIERLLKVVSKQPENLEAILNLAEAYERKGDKSNAVRWYQAAKKFFRDSPVSGEIDKRIRALSQ